MQRTSSALCFQKKPVLKLDLDKEVRKYKLWLKKQENKNTGKAYSPYTVQYYMSYIKSFYLQYLDETEVKKKMTYAKNSQAALPKKKFQIGGAGLLRI